MFVPLTASFLSLLPDRVLYKRTRYDLKKKEKKSTGLYTWRPNGSAGSRSYLAARPVALR